ncbi:hypothetical protein A3863_24265 [Priestia endophytica]|uniref:right-handed parallel beta-helix repeat-containing protein n=1 Tax=Priestia endophytica TaxID=135735 RepID=UPI000DCA4F59|nr:right-handed parallel beta-helix repeat-containing protein [Priestia endophytica]RAS84319.1 hypothetical protein A3863_24265 [Priestia endophytica]
MFKKESTHVELVSGGNVFKQGDEATLVFQFRNEKGALLEIQGGAVMVKIANSRAMILEKRADVNVNNTISLQLTKEDVTGWGDMRFEFEITLQNGAIHKFPQDGWYKIQMTKNLDDLSTEDIIYVPLETFTEEVNTTVQEAQTQESFIQTQAIYAKNQGDSVKQQGQASVDKIVEVNNKINILQKNQGALTELPTDDKESIVSAIKEENKKRKNQKYFVSLTDFPRITPEKVDTPRIQRAIDSMATTGGVLFVPSSTYLISGTGVNLVSNVKILGEGNKKTVFKASSMALDSNMFSGTSKSDIMFDGVGFDGANDTNIRRAVYISASETDKFLRINRCRFTNFSKSNNQTIYTWHSRFIWVTENEFVDCVIPMFIDAADRAVFIERNTIISPSGIMVNGIQVNAGANGIRPISISNNWIENAKIDATGNGIDGHGIRLYRCEGAKVIGNTVRDCISSAILVGSACWGSSIQANTIYDNRTGIYVELNNNDITLGSGDMKRGAVVNGNDCFNNKIGIAISYGAGSQIIANFVHNNNQDGIVCDSHNVSINNNTVYNNWKNSSAPSPIQLVKAGIRNYGYNGTHIGNVCFDNQTTKTQAYGIAINNANHIVGMNQLKGNGTGGIYESTTGTNQISMNVVS